MKTKMHLIFSITLILIYYQSFAQTINYNDVKIDKPQGDYTEYISKDGSVYKKGDTITIGMTASRVNDNYLYIRVLYNSGMMDYAYSSYLKNTRAILRSLNFIGSKKSGWKAQFTLDTGHNKMLLLVQAEDAFASGEIRTLIMSSEDALAELKRLKDKLDLGLITQEEFYKKKVELGKYIK